MTQSFHAHVDRTPGSGFVFTLAERELFYHTLRSLPYRDAAVGAAVVQIEGELAGVVGFQGAVHAPETASEPSPNAEIIITDPECRVRKSERSDRV